MILLDEVKKFADAGDVKSLKYIFVDSLDVDPTFEDYLDDYNYCAKKGLFEPHKNLNDFSNRQADWNDNYWQILKRDLLKNFSRERLDHMRKVALVVLADKVARLQRERQQQTRQPAPPPKVSQPPVQQRPATPPPFKSKTEQDRELEAARQKLAQENAETERQRKLQQQKIDRQHQENSRRQNAEVAPPKKSSGIAPVIAAIAAVIAVIIFIVLK